MQEIYKKRAEDFSQVATSLKKKYNQFSIVRLVIFFGGGAVFLLLWSSGWVAALFIFVFLAAFARFVYWHQDILRAHRHHQNLATVNSNELKYLEYKITEFPSGKTFIDTAHPYSVDLDIFGDHSFFQYANRSTTSIGKICFANWLKHPTAPLEISERQAAIAELKDQLDWRQDFQALGMATPDNVEHVDALKNWLNDPPFVTNKSWLIALLYLAPIIAFAGLLLWIYYIPWQLAILFFVPAGIILKITLDQVNHTHIQTAHAEKILAHYARLIQHIEPESFSSKKLKNLQTAFFVKNQKASQSVKKLSYIIRQLNVRNNVFAIFLNLFGLWDLQWIYRLEKWKATQREQLPKWFDALQEVEALLSFATLFYNNSEWVFPKISNTPQLLAEQMGHPLIHSKSRVCNNLSVPTNAHIKLITGSNMAGKSTFLRTAGLNIVLAMSGSVVCAEKFSLPILQVYSSMRTVDALHENTSSFYAELKRLKVIIEAVESQPNAQNPESVFFLLDEILKGTNSNDRHTGSKALIQQLIKSKGSGLIATHDLELGNMEKTAAGAIENLCMEVEVNGGQLVFDYKIKKGVSQSFNATQLMKQMGIKI